MSREPKNRGRGGGGDEDLLVSKKGGGRGGVGGDEGVLLKLTSMNGNRLGNYSAATALCGKGAGRKCENGRQQNGLKRNLKWAPSVKEEEEEREEAVRRWGTKRSGATRATASAAAAAPQLG